MNKKEFMYTLKEYLKGISIDEANEILYDYEEHFNVGMERGKNEEEIARELGDPKSIAKSYKASSEIENAKNNPSPTNIAKAVIASIALGFFNLVFILGPFVGLIGALIGLYAGAIGTIAGGVGITLYPIFPALVSSNIFININPIGSMFIGVGIICLGALFFILDVYISKIFYQLTVKYLKWNMDIIKK